MVITVIYYGANNKRESSYDYESEEAAFKAMVAVGKDALAWAKGTDCGCYNYDPRQEGHTLDGFKSKMARCYSEKR